MKLRMRAALLVLLGTAAVYTGLGAVKSLHPAARDALPAEIYAR